MSSHQQRATPARTRGHDSANKDRELEDFYCYRPICCSSIVHLNHAGASPSPDAVVDRIVRHMRLEQRLGGYAAAASLRGYSSPDVHYDELESVYDNIATLLDCNPDEVALFDSATSAWMRLFRAFLAYLLRCYASSITPEPGGGEDGRRKKHRKRRRRIIFVSQIEYAANLVAACQWVKEQRIRTDAALRSGGSGDPNEEEEEEDDDDKSWTVRMLPSQGVTGKVDPRALERILSGDDSSMDPASVAMVCVTHVSTSSGLVNPIEEIGQILHRYNQRYRVSSSSSSCGEDPPVLYLVDACQSVGQFPVSVRDCGPSCHGLVGTGRKWLRGPRGTGFLYCSRSLLSGGELWPDPVDHFGAPVVRVPPAPTVPVVGSVESVLEFAAREGARRFEFWESSVANRLGLGVAVQLALEEGLELIRERILERATYLHRQLAAIPRVRTLYPPECGIVSFWVIDNGEDEVDRTSDRLQEQLWEHGFEVVVSPATSTPLDSSLTRAPNVVRVSTSYTNTIAELDDFLSCLRKLVE
jgi:selenocysteine lyase/cysteine desulfurase